MLVSCLIVFAWCVRLCGSLRLLVFECGCLCVCVNLSASVYNDCGCLCAFEFV